MAIINSVSGNELEIMDFIMSCMDCINSEADDATLMKIPLDYLKSFIDTFEQNDILPILNRAKKVYVAQFSNRPIDVQAMKIQHNDEFANGTRTEEIVEKELPTWPTKLSNPHRIKQLFGANAISASGKKRKGISVITNSKLLFKATHISKDTDCLYLVEYFLKFFFIPQEKNYFLEYDAFINTLKTMGFVPKQRNQCFLIKDEENILKDIICLFLSEDMDDENNREFINNCIDRYYELYL